MCDVVGIDPDWVRERLARALESEPEERADLERATVCTVLGAIAEGKAEDPQGCARAAMAAF